MKKPIRITLIALIALVVIASAVLFGLLQSRYATPIVNQVLSQLSEQKIHVESANYTPPLQLTLEGVTIGEQQPLYLPKVELWLTQSLPNQDQWQFDAIVIEQANIDISQHSLASFKAFEVKQLAFKQSEFSGQHWSARGVDLQIDDPQWSSQQLIPFGNIQLAAEQLYLHGQALDNLLVDIDYKAQDSTVYGASFEWNKAKISGQAEQYAKGWSLVNVTIDQLSLNKEQPIEDWIKQLSPLSSHIQSINSLDILKSNFTLHGASFTNVDASLENVLVKHSIWQQEQAYLSFNADSIRYHQQQWVEPTATLTLTPQKIAIEELDSDWQQGRVQLKGDIQPNSIDLEYLNLTRMKWLEQAQTELLAVWQQVKQLQALHIQKLDINNLQIIQLEKKPFWQLSGLNLDGKKLELIRDGQFGLWQGKVTSTVNSASVDKYLTTQAAIDMSVNNNLWTLDRALLPLEQGYISANGQWQRNSLSAPWQISIELDGLPFDQTLSTEKQPLKVSGIVDFSAELSGLAGDYSMLAHSLSGEISANIRQGYLSLGKHAEQQTFEQSFALDDIAINADRGRISLHSSSNSDQPTLAGKVDLTKPELATFILESQHLCQHLQFEAISGVLNLRNLCQIQSTPTQQSSLESSTAL